MMSLSVVKLFLVELDPVPDCHAQWRSNGRLSFTSHVDEERRKLCENISVIVCVENNAKTYHAGAARAARGPASSAS